MKIIKNTKSLCHKCLGVIPADICEDGQRIVLQKECPEHGKQEELISNNIQWFYRTMNFSQSFNGSIPEKDIFSGQCPYDCGLCEAHTQRTYLPVVPITSACNLDCPVCYTFNKNVNPYFMDKETFSDILYQIHDNDPEMQIINFTGGEPLMHPEFCDLVEMCRDAGMHRISISTNGLQFLKDEKLLPRLTEFGARIVLSFNSFSVTPYEITAGRDLKKEKLKILNLLEKYKPSTTLLTVVASGVNDHEIGDIVRYIIENDFIISSEIHTVTFTGQNIGRFDRNTRITTPDIIDSIIKKNKGIEMNHFFPSVCAHPLCYSTCYLLKLDNGTYAPFASFMDEKDIHRILSDSLYLEPGLTTEEVLTDVMNDIWSAEETTERNELILKKIKNLLSSLFPSGGIDFLTRQKIAEQSVKAIYIHSHMDPYNFDIERVKQCSVTIPDGKGGNIPACAYNTIYRAKDSRFHA